MRTQTDLIESSLQVIKTGQHPGGAFLACPNFSTYRYCWFRDGTFIAQALDLWGHHEAARRFYDWGIAVILRYREAAEQAIRAKPGTIPAVYLHTRYMADGTPADDEWPNFQLDGFGTFLWGIHDHVSRTGMSVPDDWFDAVTVVADYLSHLWQVPNYDCWEESPGDIHISTLCALHGGLQCAADLVSHEAARQATQQIRSVLDDLGKAVGYLPKSVRSRAVDSAGLWACIPFGVYGHSDPLMRETARKIEEDLLGPHGGMHRYAADSYYGGGEWILLTALFGEYLYHTGDVRRARTIVEWIEQQASPKGELAEQVPLDLNVPHMYGPWVERWGAIATPLLWSHAAYLRLRYTVAERRDIAEDSIDLPALATDS